MYFIGFARLELVNRRRRRRLAFAARLTLTPVRCDVRQIVVVVVAKTSECVGGLFRASLSHEPSSRFESVRISLGPSV